MKLWDGIHSPGRAPRLTWPRMVLALAAAVAADGLQLLSGPLGWVGFDQAIDCVAMVFIGWMIGFHILLLPTFVVELAPALDELPTWTACTVAVMVLRKREERNRPPPPPPVIDV